MFIRKHKVSIPAHSNFPLNDSGVSLICTKSTAEFEVEFPDSIGSMPMEAGIGWNGPEAFQKLSLVNSTDRDIEATLLVSDGEISDNRANFSSNSPIPTVNGEEPLRGTLSKLNVTSAGVTIPENLKRKKITLQNIGAVMLIVEGGIMLDPKETWQTEATNALTLATNGPIGGKVSAWEVV